MIGSFRCLALLARALGDQIGGNGFIAAIVGGLTVRPTVESVGKQQIRFTEAEGQLLNLSVFFIFGVLVIGLFQPLGWEVAVYALLSLTVMRMLPVALSMLGTPGRSFGAVYGLVWPAGARLDSAWSGRGGGGSVARRARRDGVGGADGALLSVLLHGVSAALISAVYVRRVEGMAASMPEKREMGEPPTRVGSVSTNDPKATMTPNARSGWKEPDK